MAAFFVFQHEYMRELRIKKTEKQINDDLNDAIIIFLEDASCFFWAIIIFGLWLKYVLANESAVFVFVCSNNTKILMEQIAF